MRRTKDENKTRLEKEQNVSLFLYCIVETMISIRRSRREFEISIAWKIELIKERVD